MKNFGTEKETQGLKLFLKLIALACFVLFNCFLFAFIRLFVRNIDNITKKGSMTPAILLVGGISLFLILCAYVLPYYLFVLFPKLYYYDDGVVIGKQDNEKILYKDLDYFFISNPVNPIEFLAIWYYANGKWKSLSGNGYSKKAFKLWQEDFVKVNYPIYMKKIYDGETVEFLYHDPKNRRLGFKTVRKILEESLKIEITKNYFKVNGKEYNWDEYDIYAKIGNVVVRNDQGKTVFKLPQKAFVHKPNLLQAIVYELNSNSHRD